MNELAGDALRISIVYLYALAMIRLAGKRSIHDLTPLDFLVALVTGNMLDKIIWLKVPLSQGLAAVTTVVVLHTLVAFAESRSARLQGLITGRPTQVVDRAALLAGGMRRERTRAAEVLAHLRLQGVDDLAEVRAAQWEPGGDLSVLPTEAADEVRKQDQDALREAAP